MNSTPWVPRSNWSRRCSMALAESRSDSSMTRSSTWSGRLWACIPAVNVLVDADVDAAGEQGEIVPKFAQR
jgi:hypothetical protein